MASEKREKERRRRSRRFLPSDYYSSILKIYKKKLALVILLARKTFVLCFNLYFLHLHNRIRQRFVRTRVCRASYPVLR